MNQSINAHPIDDFELITLKRPNTENQQKIVVALHEAASEIEASDIRSLKDAIIDAASDEIGGSSKKASVKQVVGEYIWIKDTSTVEPTDDLSDREDQRINSDNEIWQEAFAQGYERGRENYDRMVGNREE